MRIVRFTPGPDAGLGQDPLFGVLEDDATISIISGDPIYSGIQKTAAKITGIDIQVFIPIPNIMSALRSEKYSLVC